MICPSCFGIGTTCQVCVGTRVVPASDPAPHIVHRDVRDFGTERYPLRSSSLQALCVCPWRMVMDFLFGPEDESGEAAATGSATHAAVAAWHQNGCDPAAAIRAMVERHGEFLLADLDEAAALFLLYSQDPRNIDARVVAVERKVHFSLPAAPEDPTGEAIFVTGTMDQVREEGGKLLVYDLKTSKKSGLDLLRAHMYQVAAYCIGASHLFGKPVHPGSLVCPRHYSRSVSPASRPPGVFFPFPWTFEDAGLILWGVRRIVAAVRSREVWHNGGEHCRWCRARGPENCLPMMKSVVDFGTMKIALPTVAAPAEVADLSAMEW